MSDLKTQKENIAVVSSYFASLAVGDMSKFASLLDENVIWHQPGDNQFSGKKSGIEEIGVMVADMMTKTQGSFAVHPNAQPMASDDLVSVPVLFSGQRNIDGVEHSIHMEGTDLFKLSNEKITEIWLFSSDQATEDKFWDR